MTDFGDIDIEPDEYDAYEDIDDPFSDPAQPVTDVQDQAQPDTDLFTELRQGFIADLHVKFPGGEPSPFLEPQIVHKDRTWYYTTELDGKSVEVRLTGKDGKTYSRSTIERQKGGRDFFKALNSEPFTPRLPLEPTVVVRQEIANQDMQFEELEMSVLKGDDLAVQEQIETVLDAPELTVQDKRELRGAASTLATISSKIKAASANLEWATKEKIKAQKELKSVVQDCLD